MAEEEGGKEEFLWKGISGTSHRSSSTYSRVGRVCFERQRGGREDDLPNRVLALLWLLLLGDKIMPSSLELPLPLVAATLNGPGEGRIYDHQRQKVLDCI